MWLRRTGGCTCAYRGDSISYGYFVCVWVCPSVCTKVTVPFSKKRLHACHGESRNQLRGLREGAQARRGAVPCLSADLTTHAVQRTFHPVEFENGEACLPRRAKRCGDERGKRVLRGFDNARTGECCGPTEDRAHRHNGTSSRWQQTTTPQERAAAAVIHRHNGSGTSSRWQQTTTPQERAAAAVPALRRGADNGK